MTQSDIHINDYGESVYAQAATRAGCDWLVNHLGARDLHGFTGVFAWIKCRDTIPDIAKQAQAAGLTVRSPP